MDNLTGTQLIQSLSPKEKEELKERTRREGKKYIELPSKGVFSIKPDKNKVRIVACGNKTHETYGKISTSDLDSFYDDSGRRVNGEPQYLSPSGDLTFLGVTSR